MDQTAANLMFRNHRVVVGDCRHLEGKVPFGPASAVGVKESHCQQEQKPKAYADPACQITCQKRAAQALGKVQRGGVCHWRERNAPGLDMAMIAPVPVISHQSP